ncbi:ankyrin repeat-containing domain protein, partial [Baffinella frigidus]
MAAAAPLCIAPLWIAARNGSVDALWDLLEGGAVVDERAGPSASTPLHEASSCGLKPAVQLLLDKGAAVTAKDIAGRTPLHRAAIRHNTVVVQLLLERQAQVSAQDDRGETPLRVAERGGHEDVVKILRAAEGRGSEATAVPNGPAMQGGGGRP